MTANIIKNTSRPIFPFTAIVGQEEMKLALALNVIDPKIGGVIIMGDRGTGKSTTIRAITDILPEIEVVKDDPFNFSHAQAFQASHFTGVRANMPLYSASVVISQSYLRRNASTKALEYGASTWRAVHSAIRGWLPLSRATLARGLACKFFALTDVKMVRI